MILCLFFFSFFNQIAYEILSTSRCRTISLCLLGVITQSSAGRCAAATMSLNNVFLLVGLFSPSPEYLIVTDADGNCVPLEGVQI